MAGWLRAVGIGERERVTVLRRAAFGGPIHVRTSSGGEFALHRALAASVIIRRIVPSRATAPAVNTLPRRSPWGFRRLRRPPPTRSEGRDGARARPADRAAQLGQELPLQPVDGRGRQGRELSRHHGRHPRGRRRAAGRGARHDRRSPRALLDRVGRRPEDRRGRRARVSSRPRVAGEVAPLAVVQVIDATQPRARLAADAASCKRRWKASPAHRRWPRRGMSSSPRGRILDAGLALVAHRRPRLDRRRARATPASREAVLAAVTGAARP